MWSSFKLAVPLILLASCGERVSHATGSFCAVAAPVYVRLAPDGEAERWLPDERPGDFDRLTTETARALLRHNMTGRVLCQW